MALSLIETEKLQEELVGSVPVKMSYLDMLALSILYGSSVKEIRRLQSGEVTSPLSTCLEPELSPRKR